MNTFYLKILILTLSFSLHGIAATLEQQVEQTRENIEFQHNRRRDMFNADVQYSDIAECSRSIDTILGNERNVREVKMSKHDLLKHQETILSAVMAKVFIDYTGVPQKRGVSIYDKREMRLDSARHRHFEILRLTEDLSDSFSAQVTKDLTFNRDMLRRSIVGEYEQIFKYSGLNHDVFLDWFETIFDTHCPGFVAKNLRHVVILGGHGYYSPTPDNVREGSDDWDDLQRAIALSIQSQGAAVAIFAARKEHTEAAALLALLSPKEIAEQARLFKQLEEEKATQDFLRAEREAQANVHAEHFSIHPPILPSHVVVEGDEYVEALDRSFEETLEAARKKITIFPVHSSDKFAETFTVKVRHLLNAVYDVDAEVDEEINNGDKFVHISGVAWKFTNHGEFIGNFTGNPDHESMIQPTAVKKASEDGLVSLIYTFRKEDDELVELKLEEFKTAI